jgi:outer membrane lipoprotein-sorting protein
MKKLLFLFLAVVLTACSALGQNDVERNQQKWQDANISHYRFQLNIGCFCAYRDQMPVTVEVQDGKVVSMTNANGDMLDETNPATEFILKYATIDAIFAELKTDEVKNADQKTVTYDATYGFPVDVSIDFSQQMADEELYLNVSGFEALP